jgi:hypothetical protein
MFATLKRGAISYDHNPFLGFPNKIGWYFLLKISALIFNPYLKILWSEVVCEMAKYVGSEGWEADSKAKS